jgi:hypothetical protein
MMHSDVLLAGSRCKEKFISAIEEWIEKAEARPSKKPRGKSQGGNELKAIKRLHTVLVKGEPVELKAMKEEAELWLQHCHEFYWIEKIQQ